MNYIFSYKKVLNSAYELARMYLKGKHVEKDEESSLKYIREHYENNSDNLTARVYYARFLHKWKRYKESIDVCPLELAINTSEVIVFFILGLNFLAIGNEAMGLRFLEYARENGVEDAARKLGKYCLKKYLDGEKTGYYFENAMDGFVASILSRRLKHFYEFFSIIENDDRKNLEDVIMSFMNVYYDLIAEKDEILGFLISESH